MAKRTDFDLVRRRSIETMSELRQSMKKVAEYVHFMSSDLKENGDDSVFHYRAELYDAMIEVFQGVTELELLRDLRRTHKAKK